MVMGHPWRKRFVMIQQGYFCVAPNNKSKHFQLVLPLMNAVAMVACVPLLRLAFVFAQSCAPG